MKLFPSRTSSSAPAPVVRAVSGESFFMRRFDLPAGMAAGEISGFVDLQLEELSPFPLDQLYYGRVVSGDGTAVFVYAAYRRRFSAEETKAWAEKMFVFPEFSGVLHLRFAERTVVLLRSTSAMTALLFEADRALPVAGAGRSLPADTDEEQVLQTRAKLLRGIGGEGARLISLRPVKAPEQRPQGLRFVYSSQDGGQPQEVTVPSADCWPMDIREASYVAQQRRRLGVDLVIWRTVQGVAAVIALLVIGEALLLAGNGYADWLGSRVERQVDEATALEDKDSIAFRVSEFDRSDMEPIQMITVVGSRKPAGVVFKTATVASGNTLEFDATTPNVAEVNAFEAELRNVPEIETVEVNDIRTRADGTVFKITVTFRPGAFAPATAQAGGER